MVRVVLRLEQQHRAVLALVRVRVRDKA